MTRERLERLQELQRRVDSLDKLFSVWNMEKHPHRYSLRFTHVVHRFSRKQKLILGSIMHTYGDYTAAYQLEREDIDAISEYFSHKRKAMQREIDEG